MEYSTTIYFEELWLAKFPALKILLLVNFFCEVENKGVQFTDLKDLQSNGQGMTFFCPISPFTYGQWSGADSLGPDNKF